MGTPHLLSIADAEPTHPFLGVRKDNKMSKRSKITFSIKELDRGFLVNVGCKQIATDMPFDNIIAELKAYFEEPEREHQIYFPEDFEGEVCSGIAVPEEVERLFGQPDRPEVPPPLPVRDRYT